MDRLHMFVYLRALQEHRLHDGPSVVKYMEIRHCPQLAILLARLKLNF